MHADWSMSSNVLDVAISMCNIKVQEHVQVHKVYTSKHLSVQTDACTMCGNIVASLFTHYICVHTLCWNDTLTSLSKLNVSSFNTRFAVRPSNNHYSLHTLQYRCLENWRKETKLEKDMQYNVNKGFVIQDSLDVWTIRLIAGLSQLYQEN